MLCEVKRDHFSSIAMGYKRKIIRRAESVIQNEIKRDVLLVEFLIVLTTNGYKEDLRNSSGILTSCLLHNVDKRNMIM